MPERAARSSGAVTPREVVREVREFAHRQERRRQLLPRALLVGLGAGLVAVAFRRALDWAENERAALFRQAHSHAPWGALLPIAVCAVGGGVALWLVRSLAPETAGSGIPHIKAVLHRLRGMRWRRVLAVKFASGVAGIGSGLALGREGPTVQMGGAVGQMVSRWFRSGPRERQTLIAAGAGAGLAAAFNAPLAGLIFVMEELRRDFAPGFFMTAFVASVTADIVTRLLLGQMPVLHVSSPPVQPLPSLAVFAALGLASGLLGVAFNRALLGSLRLFERVRRWPPWLPGAVVGAAVGGLGWFVPQALGGGGHLVESTLAGELTLAAIPLLLLTRFALTMVSYGSGTAGGIFAPLLVIGAQTGLAIGLLAGPLLPAGAEHPAAFGVVGMGALFAAIVRAPLTGIVLILEMTENYSLMLPLLIACFLAYLTADLLRDRPIYEALLERDLLRGQARPGLEQTLLVDLVVEPGSPFAGRQVSELGLPAGCLLVTIERGLETVVPTRETRLAAGDRISAVVSPLAAAAVDRLREGTAAPPPGG